MGTYIKRNENKHEKEDVMWFVVLVCIILVVWFCKDFFEEYFRGAKENLMVDQLADAEARAVTVQDSAKKLNKLKEDNDGKLVSAQQVLKEFRGDK